MSTSRRPAGAGLTLTERHPGLMSVLGLICLVIVGGLAGMAVGSALVMGVHLLLGMVGQGV